MSNGNGPGQGSNGQPVPVGTGEVRTFPASHPSRGARRSSSSCEGESDAYGNPWSRCSEANSTNKELTEPVKSLIRYWPATVQGVVWVNHRMYGVVMRINAVPLFDNP